MLAAASPLPMPSLFTATIVPDLRVRTPLLAAHLREAFPGCSNFLRLLLHQFHTSHVWWCTIGAQFVRPIRQLHAAQTLRNLVARAFLQRRSNWWHKTSAMPSAHVVAFAPRKGGTADAADGMIRFHRGIHTRSALTRRQQAKRNCRRPTR